MRARVRPDGRFTLFGIECSAADFEEAGELHDLGWCHHCETFQRVEDAPVLPWGPTGALHHCCVVCREDEPWTMGVFDAQQFVDDGTLTPAELLRLCVERVSAYPRDVR